MVKSQTSTMKCHWFPASKVIFYFILDIIKNVGTVSSTSKQC